MMGPLAAFGVTLALLPPLIRLLRFKGVLDVPGERSSHRHATPRGGGIALLIGGVCGWFIGSSADGAWPLVILGIAVAFGLLGLADDIRSLDASRRLVLQAGIVGAASPFVVGQISPPAIWVAPLLLLCTVWILSFVNAFNFMDGINGISALHVIVISTTWVVVGWIEGHGFLRGTALIVGFAGVGFLPFNFPRAQVFLGDVGSYFLGAWIATTAVVALGAGIAPEAIAAPLVVYLADTSWTLARRLRTSQVWMAPHRDHVYQRLTSFGWSHTRSALMVATTSALCGSLGLIALRGPFWARIGGDLGILVLLGLYLSSPKLLRRHAGAPDEIVLARPVVRQQDPGRRA